MSGVRCQLSGVSCQVSVVRCQLSGVSCQVSGVRWRQDRDVSIIRCQDNQGNLYKKGSGIYLTFSFFSVWATLNLKYNLRDGLNIT